MKESLDFCSKSFPITLQYSPLPTLHFLETLSGEGFQKIESRKQTIPRDSKKKIISRKGQINILQIFRKTIIKLKEKN